MKPIQVLLCIVLVLAAAHAAADPPAEAPSIPYVIELKINMPDGTPAQGAAFSAVNTRNGDTAQGATNENGTHTFSMTYHKDGDTVKITVSKANLAGSATIRLTVDSSGVQTQIPHKISITLRPPETPSETERISIQQATTAAGIATAAILGVMLVRKRKEEGRRKRRGEETDTLPERPKRKRSR